MKSDNPIVAAPQLEALRCIVLSIPGCLDDLGVADVNAGIHNSISENVPSPTLDRPEVRQPLAAGHPALVLRMPLGQTSPRRSPVGDQPDLRMTPVLPLGVSKPHRLVPSTPARPPRSWRSAARSEGVLPHGPSSATVRRSCGSYRAQTVGSPLRRRPALAASVQTSHAIAEGRPSSD